MADGERMEVLLSGGMKVDVRFGGFVVETDQPTWAGGEGSAPEPYALFLASLAACAGLYVKVFCDRRKIPTDGIRIAQSVERDATGRRLERITLEVLLPEDFPAKYRTAVARAAAQCAVKRTMDDPPEFEVVTTVRENALVTEA